MGVVKGKSRTAGRIKRRVPALKNDARGTIKNDLLAPIIPGEILYGSGDIEAFDGRETRQMTVSNTGDRPIQVGSHCHFFEANRALTFEREQAFGFRLCIPAGTAVRFEPGEHKRVTLVALGGKRMAYGMNGLTNGPVDDAAVKTAALNRAAEQGFTGQGDRS
jgi:urease beta subunit